MIKKLCFILLCIASVLLLQFGTLFLLLALLPAIIAWFVDQNPRKQLFNTIFAANFAGTLPALLPMISTTFHGGSFDLSGVMFDLNVWLRVYASAAAGCVLVYLCSIIAKVITGITFDYRASQLELRQTKLAEEWGDEVKIQ